MALYTAARYAEAESAARQMIEAWPEHGFIWKVLGTVLAGQRRFGEAFPVLQRTLALLPSDPEPHNTLGNLLQDLGRLPEAEASYRRALALKPDFHVAHSNLGNALLGLGRTLEAEASYRRALALRPDVYQVHANLGNVLHDLGRLSEAEAECREALKLEPDFHLAHSNLGRALHGLGRSTEAAASYRRAVELKPDYHEAYSNLLFCRSHDEAVDPQTLFAEHRRFGEVYETPLRALWPQHANSRDPERSLRIGFVSADLRDHAVAYMIEPVLAHLASHPRLALHAYVNHSFEDNVTRRLRGLFAHWHPIVGLSDARLAETIGEDGIDILIDLSGHTAHHRLLSFARKPAPVQASWIGYPGTTGLRAMDYYLTDGYFLPPGQFDEQFTECIVRLPVGAPFQLPVAAPPVNPLPALGNGSLTFGSFNRPSKLSPSVIALWSQLLRALPDARMVLAAMPSDGNNDLLIAWFAREGIAQERLSFRARCGMTGYLSLHQQVDVCLNTFPYTGGTTTFQALWMGVPTLTLAGNTVPARTSAGILGYLGLEAFVARDAADFVRKGVAWAGNPPGLAELRAGLRERLDKFAMGQPAMVAAGVERAFRIMWQRWCAGLPAESFEVRLRDV